MNTQIDRQIDRKCVNARVGEIRDLASMFGANRQMMRGWREAQGNTKGNERIYREIG